MSSVPPHASAVVIGAGIVGNSLVYHLARLGWKDIVLLDKGPLPNPGGSTGHASNFIFPVEHSKESTEFTVDSVRQYKALGVFTQSGGIEVARTPERIEENKRRLAFAKVWGVEAALISPTEVKQLVPYINEHIILGGFYTPEVGTVDSLRAGTLMREYAQKCGALQVLGNTLVIGIDVDAAQGRVRGVRTSRGNIEADIVIIAAGVWSPWLARMAGARMPLTPAVHQMISAGPVPLFADTAGEIKYPIIRDMDTNMYERQHGSDLEIGSYAHRPILWEPENIPSNEEARLSPTELPFTKEDFEPQMEQALELMPEILSNEQVGVRYAINGLVSLTPDGFPILGETPEVKGLWSAASVLVKQGSGIGRTVAEWITNGASEIDPTPTDIARFHEHQRTKFHVKARAAEGFNKTYGIVHPWEQWSSNRNVRLSPFYRREKELGGVFFETMGWERPYWYESNRELLQEYGARVMPREAEWESRWWSPIINAEHLAMRDRVGLVDLTPFVVLDITGPGALEYMQRMAVHQMDVAVGRVVYTPLLNERGGIRADLTVMRLAAGHFRVITGSIPGMADKKWFLDHLPADGSVQLQDATSAWCTLGLWGPRAPDLLQFVAEEDVSHATFPYAAWRWITVGTVRALASRISYVGESGWEIYAAVEQGERLWDSLWEAGEKFGLMPVGIGAYAFTMRLEKNFRAYGTELGLDHNLVEAGMARTRVKPQDFVGKEAYLKQGEEPPAALLCTLTVDDHTSASGVKRYMLGQEPILTPAGEPLVDRLGRRSYVTSAGSGPSIGKHILMTYLPPEFARVGTKLMVEYFGEHYPVTVAVVGAKPLFDPENERMKH